MRTLALLSALLLAAPVPAQPPSDNAEVRAAAAAFQAAQERGDRPALERVLAPDFLFVRGSGRIGDRREFVSGFTAADTRVGPIAVTAPLFVRIDANAAIVGGEARLTGTDRGRPFSSHFRWSDTWARRDGRWVAVYRQVSTLP